MTEEATDFVDALLRYVTEELRRAGGADYANGSVRIVDARNHLFRPAGKSVTDEELGIYALRDLCRVDEDTLDTVPDAMRLAAVARNYFTM
jgi:hypothetical protein